ncbi:MAG: hypothetical protein IOC88_13750 [Rhodobacter sp.]|nr:hypothetical protein [Rhodobacter sp.]
MFALLKKLKKLCISAFAFCLALCVPAFADTAGEEDLAQQLATGSAQQAIRSGDRIVLVSPAANASPFGSATLDATMTRVALRLTELLPQKPEVQAANTEVRLALEDILIREGLDGWTNAVSDLVRQSADIALIGTAGLSGGNLTLELALVSMRDGEVLAKTQAVPIDAPDNLAVDPEGGIAAAVAKLLEAAPQARPEIVMLPFTDGSTGIPNVEAGRYFSPMVEQAWLKAANTLTAVINDASPPKLLRQTQALGGIALTGQIWPIDRDRTRLVLNLSEGDVGLASQIVDITILRLPANIRDALDPEALGGGGGFSAVRALLGGNGPAWLRMEVDGGAMPIYEICEDTSPERVRRCDLLSLTIEADEAGDLLCFVLGDDLAFSLLVPHDLYRPLRLESRQRVSVPEDLQAVDPAKGPPVWYAYGPPAPTLIGCLLYRQLDATLLKTLTEWSGKRLPNGDARTLSDLLQSSNPRASAEAVVTIVTSDGMRQFRQD